MDEEHIEKGFENMGEEGSEREEEENSEETGQEGEEPENSEQESGSEQSVQEEDGPEDNEQEEKPEDNLKEEERPENSEQEEEGEIPDLSQLMPPTDVMTLSHLFISMLTNSSWQHLGLVPDPKTKKMEMDLKQAGLAIDIIEFLYGKLKEDMENEIASGIEDLLANLRINFVKKSSG